MYNFLSLFCLKNFYWNMATFPNKCVFNSSRLHKPIAIIQIKSLIFHVFCIYVEYESFGIWTQVCNVGNTPSWIFNMLWICVCGNFLGGYFLSNFCWWVGEEEQCCCDDGWRKGWRGTIFSLLRSTSQNINQKPLIEPNGILASQAYARFNAFMFRVLIDLGVKYI